MGLIYSPSLRSVQAPGHAEEESAVCERQKSRGGTSVPPLFVLTGPPECACGLLPACDFPDSGLSRALAAAAEAEAEAAEAGKAPFPAPPSHPGRSSSPEAAEEAEEAEAAEEAEVAAEARS